jgi:hypothetical protein
VSGEMVRPIVKPGDWGGYDVQMLRVGALARTVLIRLKYLHILQPGLLPQGWSTHTCVLHAHV